MTKTRDAVIAFLEAELRGESTIDTIQQQEPLLVNKKGAIIGGTLLPLVNNIKFWIQNKTDFDEAEKKALNLIDAIIHTIETKQIKDFRNIRNVRTFQYNTRKELELESQESLLHHDIEELGKLLEVLKSQTKALIDLKDAIHHKTLEKLSECINAVVELTQKEGNIERELKIDQSRISSAVRSHVAHLQAQIEKISVPDKFLKPQQT